MNLGRICVSVDGCRWDGAAPWRVLGVADRAVEKVEGISAVARRAADRCAVESAGILDVLAFRWHVGAALFKSLIKVPPSQSRLQCDYRDLRLW